MTLSTFDLNAAIEAAQVEIYGDSISISTREVLRAFLRHLPDDTTVTEIRAAL